VGSKSCRCSRCVVHLPPWLGKAPGRDAHCNAYLPVAKCSSPSLERLEARLPGSFRTVRGWLCSTQRSHLCGCTTGSTYGWVTWLHSDFIFEASVLGSSEKSRAMNLIRGSCTTVTKTDLDVTIMRLHCTYTCITLTCLTTIHPVYYIPSCYFL
jgi:hypothetical protein